jgi:hypothetical protein
MISASCLDLPDKVNKSCGRRFIDEVTGRTAVRTRQSSLVRYRKALVSSFILSPCKMIRADLYGLRGCDVVTGRKTG